MVLNFKVCLTALDFFLKYKWRHSYWYKTYITP